MGAWRTGMDDAMAAWATKWAETFSVGMGDEVGAEVAPVWMTWVEKAWKKFQALLLRPNPNGWRSDASFEAGKGI